MELHDPRLHAYRPDLADEKLRGQVDASNFVAGSPYRVSRGVLALRSGPSDEARLGSELIFGEGVRVFEIKNGWAWLQNDSDDYVGYAEAEGLSPGPVQPTHRVGVLRTYLYPEPDLKAPVLDLLTMNAPVAVSGSDGPFYALETGGWVWAGHTAAVDSLEEDFAAVALRFLGTPYLWGGRSSVGLDCSGLIQMAFARCGRSVPRDSDMQADALGRPVPWDGDQAVLERGDLAFWPGHVGIWLDSERFLHANAAHMMTVVEPFAGTVSRIRDATGDEVTAVRRP